MSTTSRPLCRRGFLHAAAAGGLAAAAPRWCRGQAAGQEPDERPGEPAQIAITLDLEMSRHYPRRGMTEWDYQKGNLDEATKRYAVEAARIVKQRGGVIHFFCVGRVLEQPDIGWLQDLADEGHPIGNHTYDHVNLRARRPEETQFRFQRAPWLIAGRTVPQILRENVRLTSLALRQRVGIDVAGFRTPGGFSNGLTGRADLQKMLQDFGFRWVSSKYPRHERGQPGEEPSEAVYDSIVQAQQAAQPFLYPSGLLEIPMSPISDVNAFRSTFWKREWFLEAISRAVGWAIQQRAVFDFLAHPSCLVVEDPQLETIGRICDLVEQAGRQQAAIVSLDRIADAALAKAP